jgi:hypothetical protein
MKKEINEEIELALLKKEFQNKINEIEKYSKKIDSALTFFIVLIILLILMRIANIVNNKFCVIGILGNIAFIYFIMKYVLKNIAFWQTQELKKIQED